MLNCERRIKSDLYESIQSSIVEPACAESLSIASGKFCETVNGAFLFGRAKKTQKRNVWTRICFEN